jgi:hypothetical protein
MLANTLSTNEIKTTAGTGISFTRLSTGNRTTEFALVNEPAGLPHRLLISHQEKSTGYEKRRRSVIRFDKTIAGQLDPSVGVKGSLYLVSDLPVGNMSDNTLINGLSANMMSFLASLGASTTILYDGTGNGAVVMSGGGI